MAPLSPGRRSLVHRLLGPAGVGAVVVALVLVWSCAAESKDEAARQRLFGQVIALRMYGAMDRPPVGSTVLPTRGAPDPPAWSVRFHDPALSCDETAAPVSCGAVLELFDTRREALRQVDRSGSRDEVVVQRGSLVLHVSGRLPASRRAAYIQGFVQAVGAITSFEDLADLGG